MDIRQMVAERVRHNLGLHGEMACAFYRACGIRSALVTEPKRLAESDVEERERRRKLYERMMHNSVGSCDRHGKR